MFRFKHSKLDKLGLPVCYDWLDSWLSWMTACYSWHDLEDVRAGRPVLFLLGLPVSALVLVYQLPAVQRVWYRPVQYTLVG